MDRQPANILFLFPDQHRPDWIGSDTGMPLATPNLDGLASRGVRFTRAYCDSPLCAPSRAALASGRSYERCGVVNNGQDYPLDQPTYYQALRDAGYRVAGVGKFDLHKLTPHWEPDGSRLVREWGFTEGIDNEGKCDGVFGHAALGGGRGPYLEYLRERGLADGYVGEHGQRKATMGAYTSGLPDDAYCDNWLAENGLTFLREFPAGQPWHLVVNFTGPHGPMEITRSMRQTVEDRQFPMPVNNDEPDREGLLRNRQNYAAMIENIDRLVGRFVEAVEERGELTRTLIVFASDHGEMLGDHGSWGKGAWRQASAGVPMIVAGPGVRCGATSDSPVNVRDLAATFIDYAHAPRVPGMDARSLVPVLEGKTEQHREYACSALNGWRLICDGRHKLVIDGRDGPKLFDLAEDPHERVDIAGNRPDVVARLSTALDREWKPDLTPLATALRQLLTDLQDRDRYPLDKLPQLRPGLAQLRDGFLPLCGDSDGLADVRDLLAQAEAMLAEHG